MGGGTWRLHADMCAWHMHACRIGLKCLSPEPAQRPTFEEAQRVLEDLRTIKGASLDARHRATSCPA
jgi:hypothetical protein